MTTMAPPLAPAPPVMVTPAPPATGPEHYRFGMAEYLRMMELGIIPEGTKTELIYGEIFNNMGQNDQHGIAVEQSIRLLTGLIPAPLAIRCQLPLVLAVNIPEPDIVVCTSIAQRKGKHPTAADAYLVVEVSDSTLSFDRTTKVGLYAENAIPEYWIVNLPDDSVEVHTLPDAAGRTYASRVVYGRGQSVPLLVAGQAFGPVPVDALLP